MPNPCSLDLRERVVDAVESGASRREAAHTFLLRYLPSGGRARHTSPTHT